VRADDDSFARASKLTVFDYAVLLIVAVSVVLSLVRGFTREVLALAAWVIACIAASLLAGSLAPSLQGVIANESLRVLAAFIAVFVATLIAMSLIAVLVSRLIRSAGLGLEDRLLGGVFGLARGLLIVMVLVVLGGLTALPRQPVWTEAMLSPPLEALAVALKQWLPQAMSRYISYD
jgi:membrane protein required for colicin V production